jgi:DNA-binding NarL/FixJ family response regulator
VSTTHGNADASLQETETLVLQAYARGLSTDDVAAELVVSPDEVRSHLRAVMDRLGTPSKIETLLVVMRRGLISTP